MASKASYASSARFNYSRQRQVSKSRGRTVKSEAGKLARQIHRRYYRFVGRNLRRDYHPHARNYAALDASIFMGQSSEVLKTPGVAQTLSDTIVSNAVLSAGLLAAGTFGAEYFHLLDVNQIDFVSRMSGLVLASGAIGTGLSYLFGKAEQLVRVADFHDPLCLSDLLYSVGNPQEAQGQKVVDFVLNTFAEHPDVMMDYVQFHRQGGFYSDSDALVLLTVLSEQDTWDQFSKDIPSSLMTPTYMKKLLQSHVAVDQRDVLAKILTQYSDRNLSDLLQNFIKQPELTAEHVVGIELVTNELFSRMRQCHADNQSLPTSLAYVKQDWRVLIQNLLEQPDQETDMVSQVLQTASQITAHKHEVAQNFARALFKNQAGAKAMKNGSTAVAEFVNFVKSVGILHLLLTDGFKSLSVQDIKLILSVASAGRLPSMRSYVIDAFETMAHETMSPQNRMIVAKIYMGALLADETSELFKETDIVNYVFPCIDEIIQLSLDVEGAPNSVRAEAARLVADVQGDPARTHQVRAWQSLLEHKYALQFVGADNSPIPLPNSHTIPLLKKMAKGDKQRLVRLLKDMNLPEALVCDYLDETNDVALMAALALAHPLTYLEMLIDQYGDYADDPIVFGRSDVMHVILKRSIENPWNEDGFNPYLNVYNTIPTDQSGIRSQVVRLNVTLDLQRGWDEFDPDSLLQTIDRAMSYFSLTLLNSNIHKEPALTAWIKETIARALAMGPLWVSPDNASRLIHVVINSGLYETMQDELSEFADSLSQVQDESWKANEALYEFNPAWTESKAAELQTEIRNYLIAR